MALYRRGRGNADQLHAEIQAHADLVDFGHQGGGMVAAPAGHQPAPFRIQQRAVAALTDFIDQIVLQLRVLPGADNRQQGA